MAQLAIDPCIEVTISAELRHLLSGQGFMSQPSPTGDGTASNLWDGQTTRPPNWRQIVLRRDGRRPISICGATVIDLSCISSVEAGQVRQSLAVFVSKDKKLFVGIAAVPDDEMPARPVHTAEMVKDLADLQTLLSVHKPYECFEVMPAIAERQLQNRNLAARILLSDFNRMLEGWLLTPGPEEKGTLI